MGASAKDVTGAEGRGTVVHRTILAEAMVLGADVGNAKVGVHSLYLNVTMGPNFDFVTEGCVWDSILRLDKNLRGSPSPFHHRCGQCGGLMWGTPGAQTGVEANLSTGGACY